jgi:hypothetical protein
VPSPLRSGVRSNKQQSALLLMRGVRSKQLPGGRCVRQPACLWTVLMKLLRRLLLAERGGAALQALWTTSMMRIITMMMAATAADSSQSRSLQAVRGLID